MLCEGSVLCLALAYVADNVPESRRASAFGILSGIISCAFVCGNLFTRFLSTPSSFQSVLVVGLTKETENVCLLEKGSSKNARLFKTLPSFNDTLSLLRSSSTLSLAAVVAFFSSLGEVGLYASLLYYLKAQFHFNKNQFADLMVINGIAGTISQMLLMPLLAPIVKEVNLLSVGLLFSCAHMLLYGIAWSSWVSYAAATFSVFAVFAPPCIRSIASKQVGPSEQMIAFVLSVMIRTAPVSDCEVDDSDSVEP
ncbi:hypothetical protein RJ640_020789 [Escallonia rubra]|uniref:Uncharacterized protein n=1 Tax=Escallonia rubra TaxID=112253 RepID=A0AA88QZ71_9ASTE|nr:hypothetical protein RJ640_020789 [Escallonia rubra]